MFLQRYSVSQKIVKPLIALVIIAFVIIFFQYLSIKNNQFVNRNDLLVMIGGEVLETQISDRPDERRVGLSNHTSLGKNEAMLFVFDTPGPHSFWMKNMDFPIDIIWLDSNKEIIYIEEDVSPETYPKSFFPNKNATYVLEVVSGFSKKNNIQIGNKLSW
ncbi:MAG: uncharacterized membrane protein (UPF0127 family) [Crocinitomicaceae bacterium]|jgi:uncharacterized membrane protein (UPF0127 family)